MPSPACNKTLFIPPAAPLADSFAAPLANSFAATATDVAAADDDQEGALKTSSANPSMLSRYCLNSMHLC